MDRDGLREADLRKKFGSILERYGLADNFDKEAVAFESNRADASIITNSNNLFKDKKLNKLWMKAESAGFTGTIFCKLHTHPPIVETVFFFYLCRNRIENPQRGIHTSPRKGFTILQPFRRTQ